MNRASGVGGVDGLVSMMVAEDARTGKAGGASSGCRRMRNARPRGMGAVSFVVAQVRYISAWTWAAQAAIALLMRMVAQLAAYPETAKLSIGMLSAATVLVGVPTLSASRTNRMAELEYSAPNNAASVMVARLVVLGCSSALAVAIVVAAAASSLDVAAFDAALWACPPYFLCCAGSLMVLRKTGPTSSTMLCAAWTLACSAALLALASALPDLYAHTSLATWAAAAVAACAWLVREAALTLRAAAAGLDAFSPQLAHTHN